MAATAQPSHTKKIKISASKTVPPQFCFSILALAIGFLPSYLQITSVIFLQHVVVNILSGWKPGTSALRVQESSTILAAAHGHTGIVRVLAAHTNYKDLPCMHGGTALLVAAAFSRMPINEPLPHHTVCSNPNIAQSGAACGEPITGWKSK